MKQEMVSVVIPSYNGGEYCDEKGQHSSAML